MKTSQHTIKNSFTVSGIGLHTGVVANMTFVPAPANHGIKYQRIDLEGQPIVDADVDNVVDLSRGTTIAQNGAKIYTVEHTLSALVGTEVDNVLIQLDGPEPPIMDGSSIQFVEAILKVGVEDQGVARNFYTIPKEVTYEEEERGVSLTIQPLDDYQVNVMVDYNSPVLGCQHASIVDIKDYQKDIAPCRTFVFLHELEMLHKQGLVRGGDLDNAIVIVDRLVKDEELVQLSELFNKPKVEVKKEGILNNLELRFENEPARHKLLDVMGDLALIGRPIRGHISATRPGHAANIAFAKKIKRMMEDPKTNNIEHYDPKIPPVMDVEGIKKMLPHRYPFLLIDKVIYRDDQQVAAVKNVTVNEPFFQGHFPSEPIMPGVLLVEAMAQTGGILVLNTVPDPENYITLFLKVDKCKFRKKVVPGDTLVFKCSLNSEIKRGLANMTGKAYVAGQVVAEAIMVAQIVKKEQ